MSYPRLPGLFLAFFVLIIGGLVAVSADEEPAASPASSNYTLRSHVIGAAGPPVASANHLLHATVGQPTPPAVASADGKTIYAGYWPQVRPPVATSAPEPVAYQNELFQNHPNPFNPTTTVEYAVAHTGPVDINIYNVRGQRVKTLVSEVKPPGRYHVQWNGLNDAGTQVASGVYFYRLTTGSYSDVKKLVLLK